MEAYVLGARVKFWIAAGLTTFYVLAGALS